MAEVVTGGCFEVGRTYLQVDRGQERSVYDNELMEKVKRAVDRMSSQEPPSENREVLLIWLSTVLNT